jgi:hypothetical protein
MLESRLRRRSAVSRDIEDSAMRVAELGEESLLSIHGGAGARFAFSGGWWERILSVKIALGELREVSLSQPGDPGCRR